MSTMDLCSNLQRLTIGKLFSLLEIPPNLRVRVISKLEPRAYFRIQQTCKHLLQLVKERRNAVFVEGYYLISLGDDQAGNCQLYFAKGFRDPSFESPYGVQFEDIELPYEYDERYCNLLKKHHITCRRISSTVEKRITGEEAVELFRILSPKIVYLESPVTISHEAICQLKDLEFVRTIVSPEADKAVPMISKLMSVTKELYLLMGTAKLASGGLYPFITGVIDVLNSEQHANFQELYLSCSAEGRRTKEELLEIFKAYRPSVIWGKLSTIYVKCNLRNRQSTCKVIVKKYRSLTIEYLKIDTEKGKPGRKHRF